MIMVAHFPSNSEARFESNADSRFESNGRDIKHKQSPRALTMLTEKRFDHFASPPVSRDVPPRMPKSRSHPDTISTPEPNDSSKKTDVFQVFCGDLKSTMSDQGLFTLARASLRSPVSNTRGARNAAFPPQHHGQSSQKHRALKQGGGLAPVHQRPRRNQRRTSLRPSRSSDFLLDHDRLPPIGECWYNSSDEEEDLLVDEEEEDPLPSSRRKPGYSRSAEELGCQSDLGLQGSIQSYSYASLANQPFSLEIRQSPSREKSPTSVLLQHHNGGLQAPKRRTKVALSSSLLSEMGRELLEYKKKKTSKKAGGV